MPYGTFEDEPMRPQVSRAVSGRRFFALERLASRRSFQLQPDCGVTNEGNFYVAPAKDEASSPRPVLDASC
jgi:hypothetical protein